MLLYLLEILKAKQSNSYESACNYVVEIFKYFEKQMRKFYFRIYLEHMELNQHLLIKFLIF